VLLCPAMVSTAQVKISSPYSIYGLGNLYGVSSQITGALGGTSAAFSSPFFINPANPASYMALDSNSFVFDGAFNMRSGSLSTIELPTQKTRFGSLSNMYVGFPVAKWWRSSLGIMPFSSVGYEIHDLQTQEGIGRILNIYKGDGGLNKAYFGNAFSPIKNLSIGINVSYIFGNINKQTSITFPDSAAYLSTKVRSSARLNNLNFDAGLIYRVDLKDGKFMQFGLTYRPKQMVDGRAEKMAYTYVYNVSQDIENLVDTISYQAGNDGTVTLPASMGAGFMIGVTTRWFAIADIDYQKWSDFRYLGSNPGMKDNLRISLGGQFRPSPINMGKYYERMNYRAGLRYEQTYLELGNTRINDLGISLGVGLPMGKSRSTLNIAVELGMKGTTNNDLIKENYMKITIGTALQERWFIKRRYN